MEILHSEVQCGGTPGTTPDYNQNNPGAPKLSG